MPITPTDKIWMNGELVDWDAAQIHVLTHTLHYGMGVFEGIRAYETADGPAVFRLTDHMERLHNSARIMMMDLPYSVDELVAATKDVVRASGLPSAYIRPIAYYGYGEMGLNTLPCTVDVAIACWPWGAYLGDDAASTGRAHEDLVVDAPRPQHDAPGVQDHRQLRELVAGQGRGPQVGLRRGHHVEPPGLRQRVHRREHLRRPRRGAHHPARGRRRPRGHHPGLGHGHRARPRLRVALRQPHPQRPLRVRGDVRVRHRGGDQRGELGGRPPHPVPRPHDHGAGRRVRAGPCGARSTATRTGSTMSTERSLPRRSRSSTPPCATAPSSRASR